MPPSARRSKAYIQRLRKILADPKAKGPGYDELREEMEQHTRDATLLGAEEADRIEAARKNDAAARAKADRINREWEIEHNREMADLRQQRERKNRAELEAENREHERQRLSEHTAALPGAEFPKTREAWEKYVHDYEKETKRLARNKRNR